MAQSLFQMATTGKNVAAAIFWMKARAGWREKSQVEHSGGLRQSYVVYSGVPRGEMTGEEWLAQYGPQERIGDAAEAREDDREA